jgi:hypothetical protein
VRRLVSFLLGFSVLVLFTLLTACSSGTMSPDNASASASSGNGSGSGGSAGSGSGSGSGGSGGSGSGSGSPSYVDYMFLAYGGNTGGGSGPNNVLTYGVDASGAAIQTGGFDAPNVVYSVASTQQFLFLEDGSEIDTYPLTANNASITPASTTPAPETPGALSVDRTGQTLYLVDGAYSSYAVAANGTLTHVNSVPASPGAPWNAAPSFTPNDEYAYTSGCSNIMPDFYGFQRAANGAITPFDTKTNLPAGYSTANSPQNDCIGRPSVASDTSVIFGLNPDNETTQFAVYTIAADGTLSATDTAATMTTASYATDYAFDPTGTWLAVSTSSGLSVYRFASGQLTLTSSAPVTNSPPQQLLWDASGHIFWYGLNCCGSFLAFSVSSSGQLTELPQNPETGPYGPLGGADWILQVQPLN